MERKYENVKKNRKEIILNNFLGGFFWAIGATVGIALLITILGSLSQHINLVPIIGNFVSHVIEYILSKNPNLLSHSMPFLWSQYAYA